MTPLIQTIYSPYQMIERASQPNGLMALLISGGYFQKVYDLSPWTTPTARPIPTASR